MDFKSEVTKVSNYSFTLADLVEDSVDPDSVREICSYFLFNRMDRFFDDMEEMCYNESYVSEVSSSHEKAKESLVAYVSSDYDKEIEKDFYNSLIGLGLKIRNDALPLSERDEM